ncbi:metallophosphoesterase [Bradyrhizobium sp. 159]|uniref:metallophosphoesterase family protein n=1 Tax=unclassified Bradyrhizobium TaxID=2631580 RepID=UPI001FFA0B1C|nr:MULTISPECIES: metallophosphoesterase [unclassified Bradyrhizobium]MCK1619897.1 metallophosphoesterase [Bradyrhizobium sp. 159]MCK1664805.1 metallophosphoesterase [Bradyrhizobium sp. 153]
MAPPAIALRFRDTTPGIDTIAAHRELIAQTGRVGWGWWKKTFEPAETEKIVTLLNDQQEIGVVLIDRTAERAYLCACVGFVEPKAAETGIVPAYYRHDLDKTAGVFILRSIEDQRYDQTLADAIREQTFLWIGAVADPALGHIASAAEAPGRSCVLHLSDLHFGKDYGFRLQDEDVGIGDGRQTLTACIVADLDRLGLTNDVAAVIVTGDFMTHGDWAAAPRRAALAEFEALRKRLGLQKDQIIVVPGNHDVVRYSDASTVTVRENAVEKQANYEHETMFRTFVDELVGRDWKASLNYVRRVHLGAADLDVCVLNSCTIAATEWTEYGYVGRNGLDAIADLAKQKVERPTFRFLAIHHHLLPVANVEAPKSKGVTLTLDASEILAAAQRAGVNVALHGHQHKPKIAMYQSLPLNGDSAGTPIHVIANGSAGAKNERLPPGERNTYCLFRLRADAIDMWIRELRLDAVAGAQVFHGALPITPVVA